MSHSFTSARQNSALRSQEHSARVANVDLAKIEVFRKTLGFFTALSSQGCSFVAGDSAAPEDDYPRDSRSKPRPRCPGRIILKSDQFNHSYLEYVRHSWYRMLVSLID